MSGFGRERFEDIGERVVEAGHALVFEGVTEVGQVDTEAGEPGEHCRCVVDVAVDRAGHDAVVLECCDGGFGEGVDRVRTGEIVDVQGVGICRVLR